MWKLLTEMISEEYIGSYRNSYRKTEQIKKAREKDP